VDRTPPPPATPAQGRAELQLIENESDEILLMYSHVRIDDCDREPADVTGRSQLSSAVATRVQARHG
jgi:hypothetical protein